MPLNQTKTYYKLSGSFDIIGDLHGCFDELKALLLKLGYDPIKGCPGRKAVFLGDLTDRGPNSLGCYQLVSAMVKSKQALCVMGNHDDKLLRYLKGNDVQIKHGLETTLAELEAKSEIYKQELQEFLSNLASHYLLDQGKLVVAHAGIAEELFGKEDGRSRSFCLYGANTGKLDSQGLPTRLDWAKDYKGRAKVVYGHTPTLNPRWLNQTINIDTGCVFGGKLTALRYPELELVQVEAKMAYRTTSRPFLS